MKRNWQPEELIEHWTLLPSEEALLKKKTASHRLGLALLLKFYQYESHFPTSKSDIPTQAIRYVAEQLKLDPNLLDRYNFNGRTVKAHRVAVRDFLGFREATLSDQKALLTWLESQVLAYDLKIESLLIAAYNYLRSLSIEPPTPERLERIVRSALRRFEQDFEKDIALSLPQQVRENLDKLLITSSNEDETPDTEPEEHLFPKTPSPLTILKSDPGRIGLDSWISEGEKLQQLRQLGLPPQLFSGISLKVLEIYKQRGSR